MKRVLLQGSPPAERLAAGERLRLNTFVADDMGEDAGEVGMRIHVSVTREMTDSAPESTEHGHDAVDSSTAEDPEGLHRDGAKPLEAGSFIIVPRGQHQHSGDPSPISPELILQPSRSAGESSCSFSMQFTEDLHSSCIDTCDHNLTPATTVLITVSAPRSQGVLPLTIGPILLMPDTDPQQRCAPPATWSRVLHRRPCSRGSGTLSLRLLEQNAREGGIDSSLWDAGLVLGAYLSHMWATDRPSIGFRTPLNLHNQAREGPGDDDDDQWKGSPLDALTKPIAVELGCGTGCAGLMLAGAMKAYDSEAGNRGGPFSSGGGEGGTVLLTDGSPEAVGLAQRNSELNGLSGLSRAGLLRWGGHHRGADVAAAASARLIFAADVVYDERMFWPLVETLQALALGSWAALERNGGDNASAATAAAAAAVADDGFDAAAAPAAATPDAAEVVLAYRLRTEPKSAEHFWHLLTSCFEVAPPVSDGVLEEALSAWGMDCSPLEGGVSVYHLKPRPQEAASGRNAGCLYCQRMLMPQSRERCLPSQSS